MKKNIIEKCIKNLYSAVIADTLDSFGYHKQAVNTSIHALESDRILCGFARTGIYMPIYHDDEDTNVYEYEIELIDSLLEGEVCVLSCNNNKNIAPWGELLTTRAKYLKAAGCLTDGCIRDSSAIKKMNFPIFSNGTNPVDTKFRGKMIYADIPAEIGGVLIKSGDLIFGDQDGLVSVPSELINSVVEKSFQKVSQENTVRKELNEGKSLKEVFRKHGIL
mgnify:CR=1 FL=1